MYRSPIRLAGLEPAAGFSKQTLSLARKKMLAELELGDGHAVLINGAELNRQDIAHLFDELADEQKLTFHIAIFNDPALLLFLEEGIIKANGPGWTANELYDTPGFRSFVSPYFAAAVSVLFQKVLSGGTGSGMLTKFLRQRSYLLPSDHETAYAKVTRYFLEIKNRILFCLHQVESPGEDSGEYYTEQTTQRAQIKVTKDEIECLCSDYDIFVLNKLPGEFDDLRYSLVNMLNNICVVCDHEGRPALAYAAISKATAINCESLQELVQKNKAIVYDKMQPRAYRTTTPPRQREQPMRWVGIIAFVLITIMRLAGTNGCGNSYHADDNIRRSLALIRQDRQDVAEYTYQYHRLVVALYGLQKDTLSADSGRKIHLLQTMQQGADLLRPAWPALGLPTMDKLPASYADSATVFIENKSAWPAIILYMLDRRYFSSAYVLPHSRYQLSYTTLGISVDIYSGNKWSEKKQSVVNASSAFTIPVQLLGGFRKPSAYLTSAANSYFSRTRGYAQPTSDTLEIRDSEEFGTIFSQHRDTTANADDVQL